MDSVIYLEGNKIQELTDVNTMTEHIFATIFLDVKKSYLIILRFTSNNILFEECKKEEFIMVNYGMDD